MGAASLLRGRTVLITSGPTREPLDAVRYLTNASSGRMGFALAAAARRRGARVVVVSGPVELAPPAGVGVVRVLTALQMRRETLRRLPRADVLVAAAAVGDWRFSRTRRGKVKRAGALSVRLVPNPDIVREAARRRDARPAWRRKLIVGFALESGRALARARAKMVEKGLDLVVANTVEALGSPRGRATVLRRDGRRWPLAAAGKERLAERILDRIEESLP